MTSLISIAIGIGLNYLPNFLLEVYFSVKFTYQTSSCGRSAYGFTKTAMKVYNSTSPVEAVKVAAVSIIDDCATIL